MSEQAQREMTLREWVDRLPETHSARHELAELERHVSSGAAAGTDALREAFSAGAVWHHRVLCGDGDRFEGEDAQRCVAAAEEWLRHHAALAAVPPATPPADGTLREMAVRIVSRTVEACARAEGFDSFKESDWSPPFGQLYAAAESDILALLAEGTRPAPAAPKKGEPLGILDDPEALEAAAQAAPAALLRELACDGKLGRLSVALDARFVPDYTVSELSLYIADALEAAEPPEKEAP